MTNNETLAYLAGIFDSEGAAMISKGKDKNSHMGVKYSCRLSVMMTDNEPINLLHKTFGGYLRTDKRNEKRRLLYVWIIISSRAAVTAQQLLPYILIDRKKQAMNCVIEFAKTLDSRRGRTQLSEQELYTRELLYKKCKILNACGQHAHNSKSATSLTDYNIIPDIKYLAGLTDGDGYCGITKSSKYTFTNRISLSLVDGECVKAFHNYFGGNITTRKPKEQNNKPLAVYSVQGREASRVAKCLTPHLLIANKQMACKCVADFSNTGAQSGGRRARELKQYQQNLYMQCAIYNRQIPKTIMQVKQDNKLQLTFL